MNPTSFLQQMCQMCQMCHIGRFMRKRVKQVLALTLILNPVVGLAALNGSVANPNIIIFIADDMGWGDSRAYNPDAKFAMPNLEKLASEGMRFNDAHTSGAKCAPARYSILSGNYQYRGLQKWGQWNYRGGSQFLTGQRTLGDVAKDAGYATAYIGKMHLGGEFYRKNTNTFVDYFVPETDIDFARGMFEGPLTYGFDYDYVILRGIQRSPYAYFENDQLVGNPNNLSILSSGTGLGASGLGEIIADGIGLPNWDSSDVGPTIAQKALDFIDTHHQQNINNGTTTPFFMFYSPEAAHGPFTPPVTFLGEPVRGVTGVSTHTDMVYENDVALGKLIEALEVRNLDDDTLIVFTSDNGGLTSGVDKAAGHFSVANLAGRKGEILEGGHRVPLVVKWGDGTSAGSIVAPGSVTNQMVGSQDLMATIAAMLDQTLPAEQARDSFNILPVLLGQQSENSPIRDHLMMEADTVNGIGGQPRHWAYREGPWKLIFDTNDNPDRLFNLDTDISETNNLVNNSGQASRVQGMTTRYLQQRQAQRTAPTQGQQFSISLDAKTAGVDSRDAPGVSLATGSSVEFTFDVTNDGSQTLNDIRVYSRQTAQSVGPWISVCTFASLAPGATQQCSRSDTVLSGLVRIDAAVQSEGATYNNNDRTFYTGGGAGTPQLSVSPTTVNESDGNAIIAISLSAPASQTVTASLAASNGSASTGSDYTFTPSTVTIPANQSNTTASVTIVNDSVSEGQESFAVTLSNPVNATLGTSSANVTIIDDDNGGGTPTVSLSDVSVNESAGTAEVTVSLSPIANVPVSALVVTVSGGTATQGIDYFGIAPQTVSIPAGASSATVGVTILDDVQTESTETINMVLRSPTNAQLGTANSVINIIDDDGANGSPTVSISNQAVSEGIGIAQVGVDLSSAATSDVTVMAVTTTGGSATQGGDFYGIAPETFVIPAGQTRATFGVVILNDTQSENDETIAIRVLNVSGAEKGASLAFLTILDDDAGSGIQCGAPSINTGSRDIHLWRDCGTDQFHLLATGGSETNPRINTSYIGSLTSNQSFSGVSDPATTQGLEATDIVDNSVSTKINFTLRMASGYGGIDPVNFTTTSGATTCLDLTSSATPRRVLVGPSKTPISSLPFNIVTLAACN